MCAREEPYQGWVEGGERGVRGPGRGCNPRGAGGGSIPRAERTTGEQRRMGGHFLRLASAGGWHAELASVETRVSNLHLYPLRCPRSPTLLPTRATRRTLRMHVGGAICGVCKMYVLPPCAASVRGGSAACIARKRRCKKCERMSVTQGGSAQRLTGCDPCERKGLDSWLVCTALVLQGLAPKSVSR